MVRAAVIVICSSAKVETMRYSHRTWSRAARCWLLCRRRTRCCRPSTAERHAMPTPRRTRAVDTHRLTIATHNTHLHIRNTRAELSHLYNILTILTTIMLTLIILDVKILTKNDFSLRLQLTTICSASFSLTEETEPTSKQLNWPPPVLKLLFWREKGTYLKLLKYVWNTYCFSLMCGYKNGTEKWPLLPPNIIWLPRIGTSSALISHDAYAKVLESSYFINIQ